MYTHERVFPKSAKELYGYENIAIELNMVILHTNQERKSPNNRKLTLSE